MSLGSELAKRASAARTVAPEPSKVDLGVLLAGGIVTWICIEVWLDFLFGDFHHEVDPNFVSLTDLSIGIAFAAMSVVIVRIFKLNYAGYFAIFVGVSTVTLFFTPYLTSLLHDPEWSIATTNAIGLLVRSLSLIAVASIFANNLPAPIADQLRLRLPKRRIVAFGLPVIVWVIFSFIISQVFAASGVDVHTQNHVIEKYVALGSNPLFAVATLAIIVPIGEEMLFRGFMVPILRAVSHVVIAILVSAALFTFMHIDTSLSTLHSNVYVFGMGVLLAATSSWSGSIWPAALVHSVNNTVAVYEVSFT